MAVCLRRAQGLGFENFPVAPRPLLRPLRRLRSAWRVQGCLSPSRQKEEPERRGEGMVGGGGRLLTANVILANGRLGRGAWGDGWRAGQEIMLKDYDPGPVHRALLRTRAFPQGSCPQTTAWPHSTHMTSHTNPPSSIASHPCSQGSALPAAHQGA